MRARAEIDQDAASAGRIAMVADPLAVQHQDLVIVVEVLRAPVGGELRPQDRVRRADIDPLADQPETLGDPVVVAVDRQGRHPQGGKGQDRGAGLRPDPRDRLQPAPRGLDLPVGQEGEVEASAPIAERPENGADARRLQFRPGHARDGGFDLRHVRVDHRLPIREARPQRLEGPAGFGVAGPVGQERGDEFADRIEAVEIRDRAAVDRAEPGVDGERLLGEGGIAGGGGGSAAGPRAGFGSGGREGHGRRIREPALPFRFARGRGDLSERAAAVLGSGIGVHTLRPPPGGGSRRIRVSHRP